LPVAAAALSASTAIEISLMPERLFQKFGHRYVLAIFLLTRLVGLAGAWA